MTAFDWILLAACAWFAGASALNLAHILRRKRRPWQKASAAQFASVPGVVVTPDVYGLSMSMERQELNPLRSATRGEYTMHIVALSESFPLAPNDPPRASRIGWAERHVVIVSATLTNAGPLGCPKPVFAN